jgi:hypothetical protein
MRLLDTDKAQAVFFFGDDGISKELLYPEFEALLEDYVPIQEWADTQHKAVYLEFNYQFCPTALVFFTMEFNSKGHVDAAWNLPLVEMARTAHKGPDLGAGPVHLVTARHCPITFFEDWLWDPDLDPKSGHCAQMKIALKRNRLGLHFKSTGVVAAADDSATAANAKQSISREYVNELRANVAQLLKDHDQQMTELKRDHEQSLQTLAQSHTQQVQQLQRQLQQRDTALADALLHNQELKATVDGQVQKIEGLREYFEHKLQRFNAGDSPNSADSNALEVAILAEADAKIAAATRELTEMLKIKEVELGYRQENEEQLRQQLQDLSQINDELTANGGTRMLERLSAKGVNFVTYQPGVGHITIPLSDIAAFLESPSAYTAEYCGVTEEHYAAWLKHYRTPVCMAPLDGDDTCAADLVRVVDPTKFILGESDYCLEHGHKTPAKKP